MGDIIKAIYDDIQEYENLCRHYGEKVRMKKTAHDMSLPDCYGKHAKELKHRREKEWKKRDKVLAK